MEVPTRSTSVTSSGNLTLKAILSQCQEKKQSHNRLLEYLKKIYHSTPFVEFCDEFEHYLLLALQTPEPNFHANYIFDFVAKFVTSLYVPPENKENDMNVSANSTMADVDPLIPLNENPLLIRLMKYLVQMYDVVNVSFRLHIIRLLKLLLVDMNSDASIDDVLFENLTESLLVCLKDKVAAIRVEAVGALFRLQDPSNKECPVTKQYLQHLKLDPNPQVREAILRVIGATTITLESVIDRTRDEKDKVRKRAYEYLAEKVHIKALTISRRVRLLKEGLQDRSELVKTTVVDTLVPTWLNMCGGSVVTFLRCLDVGIQETEESLNVTKLALDAILDNITMEKAVNDFIKTLTKEKIIPHEELSCENSFYWLYLIKFLKKQDAEDGETFLEQMQPELIHFCQYIKSYITTVCPTWDLNKKLDHQFICEQLLGIASNYDLADMAGSQRLNAVVNDILVSNSCSASLVKPLIACIIKTKQDPEERLVMVAEMISNIKEPILTMEFEVSEEERKNARIKIAKIRVELNELQENLKTYVENEEFAKAQETKEEIQNLEAEKATMEKGLMPSTREVRTEKNDTDTLLKCMTMVTELMLQAPFKKMFPTLHTLMDTLLINGLHNPDPAVRKQGVLAVGLCSVINVSVANTYFVIFLQILQMDQPSIQLMSLKVIFDLLHMHGLEMFQPAEVVDESNETVDLMAAESSPHGEGRTKTVTNVVTILKSHLDSKIDDIRAITAQGLGKLLLLGHIYSSELLSHMILLWFNPTNDSNSLLVHFLGVFIPTYAARNGRQCFEEAFIPTLKTVLDAPHTSPLSRVNAIHMAKVILQLMQPLTPGEEPVNRNPESELDVQESKPHDRIAEKICYEILKDADNSLSNQKLSQILTTLYLSSTCLPVHKNIITLITKLKKRVRDKITLKNVDNFSNILKAILDSELTIDENNTQSSQNEIDSASSQMGAEVDVIPETSFSSTDSAQPSPPKQMRRDEDSESSDSFLILRKKERTKKKGRPKRNALQTTPLKTAEANVVLTQSQEKVVGNKVRVKLVRLPPRKSPRIALTLTTSDSDSDSAAMLPKTINKIQEPEKRPNERHSSKSQDSVSIRREDLITRNQETPIGISSIRQDQGNAINKRVGRPVRATVNISERPTSATVNSSERPTRVSNKSVERPVRGSNRSVERPVRGSNRSVERPMRGSNRSVEWPVRGSNRSVERPARGSNKSVERPARGSNKSVERPARGSNKSVERPARGSNKSVERPARGSNKSVERPARGSNKSIEQPARGSNKSVERPARGSIKSVERPARGSIKSVERPARGSIKSVERPARGSIKSVERPARGSIKSVERPARGSIKNVEQPARGSSKSIERPARGSNKSIEQSARGGPRSVERPARGGLRSTERPVRGGLRSAERPVRGGLRSAERPARGGLRSAERPARGDPKSVERAARGDPKSVERLARGDPKSVERLARGDPKSVERPARGDPKSVEKPARGRPKSVEKPARGRPKSVEKPARGRPKSVEKPAKGSRKSVEKPARGSRKSVERPPRSSRNSVERPARGSRKSVERPARGSQKSVERPARGSQKSVERPARGRPKSVESPARGRPKSVESPARGRPKSVEKPARGRPKSVEKRARGSPKSVERNARGSPKRPARASTNSMDHPTSYSKISREGVKRANRSLEHITTNKRFHLERNSSGDSEESDLRSTRINNKRKESLIISSPERQTRSNKKKEHQSKLLQKNEERLIRTSGKEKSNSSYVDSLQNQGPKSTTINKSPASLRSKNHQRISRVGSLETSSDSPSLLTQQSSSNKSGHNSSLRHSTRLNSTPQLLSPSKRDESFTPNSYQRKQIGGDAGHSSTRLTRSNPGKTMSESTPKPTASKKKKPDPQKIQKHGLSSTLSPNASVIESVSDDSVFSSPSPKRSTLDSSVTLSKRTTRKPLRYVEASDDDSFTSLRSSKTSPGMRQSLGQVSQSESESNSDVNKKSLRIAKSSKMSRPREYPSSDSENDSHLRRLRSRPSFSPNKSIENSDISKSTGQSERLNKDARSGVQPTSSPETPSYPRKTRLQWKNASDISSESRLQLSSSDESDIESL